MPPPIQMTKQLSSTDLTTNKSTQAVGGWETLDIIVTGFAREASICKSVKVQKPWGLPEKEAQPAQFGRRSRRVERSGKK